MLTVRERCWFGLVAAGIGISGPLSSAHSQQPPPGFFGIFNGVINSAIVDTAQREWRNEPATERDCLANRGVRIEELAAKGITPSDPRVHGLIAECDQTAIAAPEHLPAAEMEPQSPYVLEGLQLGDEITKNPIYATLRCNPSEMFQSFTWCTRQRDEDGANGQFASTTAVLHSADGRLVYMWKMIAPASFGPGDINREIERLSKAYKQPPKILAMPPKAGSLGGVIISWGSIVLLPVDAGSMQVLASGKTLGKGFLVDFLGNFKQSAEQGLPVYLISGGAGTLWSATYDDGGRGNLRLTIADASQFARGTGSPAASNQNLTPTVPAFDPSQFAGKVAIVGESAGVPNTPPASGVELPTPTVTATPTGPLITQTGPAVLPSPSQSPAPVPQAVAPTAVPTALAPNVGSSAAVQTVIAEGIGKDVESAAKNAAENALTQVVGTFVQSDKVLNKRTEINNGIREESRSIDTKIREYSQGSIKSFEVLDSSEDSGLFRLSARVGVRVEDFKAFVMKLAEGETTVEPGIFAQAATQAAKTKNGKDLIVNNILVPLIQGQATEFNVGTPQIYSEWEHSQPPAVVHAAQMMMSQNNAPRQTIVIPVNLSINPSFLQNARQILDSIAFVKKRVESRDIMPQGMGCYGVASSTPSFDRMRDGFIAIDGNTADGSHSLADVYLLKDAGSGNETSSSCANGTLVDVASRCAFRDFGTFLIANSENVLPDLLVSLYGSEGTVGEYLITRALGKRSADHRAFTGGGWSSFRSDDPDAQKGCFVVAPNSNVNLFLNLPLDQLSKVKRINLKLQSK